MGPPVLQDTWTCGRSAQVLTPRALVVALRSWTGTSRGGAFIIATTPAAAAGAAGVGRVSVTLGPGLRWFDWAMDALSIQHLQQQVVQRHFVLTLHAVEVLHAFVAAGSVTKERWWPHLLSNTAFCNLESLLDFTMCLTPSSHCYRHHIRATETRNFLTVFWVLPHVPDVGEQQEQLGLSSWLVLSRAPQLADMKYERIGNGVQHVLHCRAVVKGLHCASAERKGT